MVKLFNIFKRSKKQLAQKEVKEFVVSYEPQGTSGTSIYSGYIQEDHIDSMLGTERAEIFDEMRKGDSNVKMCLKAVKDTIKSAVWTIQAAGDSAQEKKDAEFIEHILFNDMEKNFKQFLSEALTLCDFGFSVFEVTHKIANHKKFGNYNGILNLAWRSPKTIERWNVDRKTERLISVTQQAYGDTGKTIDIPAEYLIVFNIDQEGSNFEGVSLLRSCYGNWFRKNLYLKLNAAGIEKYAIPTPTAEVPDGLQNSQQYNNLINSLQAYTSHQKNYLTYPSGWKVDIKGNNSYDPSKVDMSVDSEDKRMTKSFLANFLELGMNGTGAYSLSNDLSDFFLSGLEHIADEICDKLNSKLIPQLIKMNFGERDYYPKLTYSGISDKAGKELAEVFGLLTNSNILIPDDRLEEHVRSRYKLPERSFEGQRMKTFSPFENQFSDKFKRAGVGKKWRR